MCYHISAQEIDLLLAGTGLLCKSGKHPPKDEWLYNFQCLEGN